MPETIQILLVASDPETRSQVERELPLAEYRVTPAASRAEAVEWVSSADFDAVLVDLDAPGAGGLDLVRDLLAAESRPEVLVLTGPERLPQALEALGLGAFNYLLRPLQAEAIASLARRAREKKAVEQENVALRKLASQRAYTGPIIAESPAMKALVAKLEQVARSNSSVLISGETGSGKGLVARAIHQSSARSKGPFIHVNCAALQETLLESELFGHERGAFTGAVAAKLGLFEVAHGGTLFLDEIGEMGNAIQAKLLQVLDTGALRRVGGTRERSVDARILTATKKSLKEEVRGGRFREDLFFRLNVVGLEVPPLRDRKEDIPALVELFLRPLGSPGRPARTIARRAVQLLMVYHWPGNVRELANVIESASVAAVGSKILPEDLPSHLQPAGALESRAIEVPLPLAEMERLHILRALDYTDGKKAPAARLLGIDVKTLSRKIELYKLEP